MMRSGFVLVIAFVLGSASCDARRSEGSAPISSVAKVSPKPAATSSGEVPGGLWVLAKSEDGGKLRIARFRSDLATYVGVSHPYRIELAWAFGGASGLPDDATLEAMATFEDRLVSATPGNTALLVSVTTGDGVRRWTIHAAEREQAVTAFRTLLSKVDGGTAVTIDAAEDPGWSKYKQLVASAKRN